MTVKACLKSMRLRTLPLSLSGIVVGVALAATAGPVRAGVVATLMLTAALLQVLSNLSNELGDTLQGTDSAAGRQGMHYSIMDGEMTVEEMKRLIAVIAGLCCVSGLAMVWLSFGKLLAWGPVLMLAFGAVTIWAAMHYTLGAHPYGYKGLGDIFVFVFFGLATVLGGAFLCSLSFAWIWVLPAAAIGCWSVGVLNVNNIRDMKTDAATRVTVAIRLGLRRARIYQVLLLGCGWALMVVFMYLFSAHWSGFGMRHSLFLLTLPFFGLHLYGVCTREGKKLDPMLPLLVMSTFATSVLFMVSLL